MTVEYYWFTALKQAIAKNRHDAHNRYLQLATVREDGTPAVRTLVFRALREEPAQLAMVTDSRSEKPAEIIAHPAGEICWYLSKTREQFRLRGTLALIGKKTGEQSWRREIWSSMSAAAREQFYWPHPKQLLQISNGIGKKDSDISSKGAKHNDESIDTHLPPDNFLMVILHVESIDHLRLRGEPQARWLSRQDCNDVWISESVNP